MNLYSLVRPLLFRLDPEQAHELAFALLSLLEPVAAARTRQPRPWSDPTLAQRIWDLDFANPIGLAAGFDKSARVPHVWASFDFGFAELGTLTAEAQPGNPRPRLFRLPADEGLINRMGFNNDGAIAAAQRLSELLSRRRPEIPLGINLGKSRSVAVDDAVADYLASFRLLFDWGDYFVINVSSPNTPGLRDLQQEDSLAALTGALSEENRRLAGERGRQPRPLRVKLAPDLADESLESIVNVARATGLNGLIATNTTITRNGLRQPSSESGGLSGRPLRQRSTEVIRALYQLAGPSLPIIGAGGVFSADDAYEKIRAGASLVQIYTGFIYQGPRLPRWLAQGLRDRLLRDGYSHIREAVGVDA